MSEHMSKEAEALGTSLDALLATSDDDKALFLTISAGNGGHEACSWVCMLLRMYEKYARRMGLEIETMDLDPYESDGLRSVTARVSGKGAFKAFRYEGGIHRLSRVSPYDQADRRQTSRARVQVEQAAAESEIGLGAEDLEISEAEVDVKTCRGGGPGGQAINKTACVAIVKHKPTGISVRCQATRSQQKNREIAMDLLRAKLWAIRRAIVEREEEVKRKAAPKADFGNRDRTYVLSQHPQVVDHRTGKKVMDVDAIMEGRLDLLLE